MIRKSLALAFDRFRRGFRRFGIFNLCALAVAVLFVLENHGVISEAMLANVSLGIFWGALSGVFVQLLCEWRAWPYRHLLVGLVTLVVGALGCWFWLTHVEGFPRYRLWGMLYWGTCFSLVAASVAVLYRVADERTLVSRLTLNAFGASGSAMILIGSLMLCILAFDKLVMAVNDKIYADVAGVLWILVFSIGFLSLLPGRSRDDGASDRAVAFLFWLLLPASLILLGILYLYLGKIVWTRSMPNGTLNWFGSVAIAAYVFFWLALRDSSRPFFRLFVRWGWALLLPVLAAQVVGIVIRYQAYGLSATRFAGMVTLSFGIVALILAALNRRPHGLFVFMAVAGIVFTVTPLNVIDVPIRNQEARLKAALARNGLLQGGALSLKPNVPIPKADAKIIVGAWNYLVDGQDLRPTVWHRPAFMARLSETVAARSRERKAECTTLPLLLGLDEETLSDRGASPTWRSIRVRLPCKETIPITGYSRLRPLDSWRVSCERRQDKWVVVLQGDAAGENDEFDVTDCVTRILNAVNFSEVDLNNRTFDLRAKDAVWPLDTARDLIVKELTAYGKNGQMPTSLDLSCCAVIMQTKGP